MVWHRFLFPAVHLVPPFHPFFPSHTFFFPFLFMSFLPSCLVISSFFSFAHTLVRPLAYSRTTSSGVLGRPGYYKEVKFIVCPWSLGFFSSQPHALGLSCPPLMSSSFSRERLRRVLRKKTSAELHLIYIFTSSPPHIHILTYISAHLHIYIHVYISAHLHSLTSTSLLIFIFTHLHLCSCSHLHMYISAHLHILTSTHLHLTSLPLIYISHLHLSLFLNFSLKARGSAAGPPRNATLCGNRARRGREMQARVRFVPDAGHPLRGSCASSARNAGESAI